MYRELLVDLTDQSVHLRTLDDLTEFGKALAVKRLIQAEDPFRTIYLTGYTPMNAAGLGFAGKMNMYGMSLLGKNLQGSRSGGLLSPYLTRLGIVGIQVTGQSAMQLILHIDQTGTGVLVPLKKYGDEIIGAFALSKSIYSRHRDDVAMAVTDPATTGFAYNAIGCNDKKAGLPHRVAGRGTTNFGRNGLVGIVVERSPEARQPVHFDKKAVAALLRIIHKNKWNKNLTGSADPATPSLGGTYGSAAKARFDNGFGLTNLFRSANVPESFYERLLPQSIVEQQIRLSEQSNIKISRHSCLAGCPNRCSQTILMRDGRGEIIATKAGEWETYQGVINLGIFDNVVETAAWVIHHSNDNAYDHIEGLVAIAALALATETKSDTGVRYGDLDSIKSAFIQAAKGDTDLGNLVRLGACAVENHYGLERHFTVGGHALPFHNGRSLLQTGVGMSWTYGRHGEACAGPGRHNFNGDPYDPAAHGLPAETHVYNTIHGMIMYGALDELGMCFFAGPSVDTLVDMEMIHSAMGLAANPKQMVMESARTIRDVHAFNAKQGVFIEPLPNQFYTQPTYGNAQSPDRAVVFNVPFDVIRDYGNTVLNDVADAKVTIPDAVLEKSKERYS